MKLEPKGIRYLSPEDWRVLTAVEQGSRNHEVVPTTLITNLANSRSSSGIHKCISALAKLKLIAKVKNARYDGYRLTYGGLDYLSLHAHLRSDAVYSVGNQIGVGKESDILVVASPGGRRLVLKIHRLGRISFRTVKANRDYLRNRSSASWMYMSRLAALKEYTFMCALRDAGFPVPEPVACNRHTVVMEFIDSFPLRQISSVPDPAALYGQLIELILRLARVGLIHGDFNEFNILVEEKTVMDTAVPSTSPEKSSQPISSESESSITLNPIIIDFPQMVSTSHENAAFYFDRDVACIKRFFERRFHFVSDEPGPYFSDAAKPQPGGRRLDVEAEASGFSKKMAKELEGYMKEVGVDGDANGSGQGSDGGDVDEDDLEASDEGITHHGVDAVDEDRDVSSHAPYDEIPGLAESIAASKLANDDPVSYAPSLASAYTASRRKVQTAKAAKGWVI